MKTKLLTSFLGILCWGIASEGFATACAKYHNTGTKPVMITEVRPTYKEVWLHPGQFHITQRPNPLDFSDPDREAPFHGIIFHNKIAWQGADGKAERVFEIKDTGQKCKGNNKYGLDQALVTVYDVTKEFKPNLISESCISRRIVRNLVNNVLSVRPLAINVTDNGVEVTQGTGDCQ